MTGKNKELRTERLTLKIAPTLKEAARQAAEKEGRTLSNYIERLIKQDLDKKGTP